VRRRCRDLVSSYLADRISADELAAALAHELSVSADNAADDLVERWVVELLGLHRRGEVPELEVRLALIPAASWVRDCGNGSVFARERSTIDRSARLVAGPNDANLGG
jgi:hypothetical protein